MAIGVSNRIKYWNLEASQVQDKCRTAKSNLSFASQKTRKHWSPEPRVKVKGFSATFGEAGFSTQDVWVAKIGVLRGDLTQLGGNDERNPSIECVDHGLELAGV